MLNVDTEYVEFTDSGVYNSISIVNSNKTLKLSLPGYREINISRKEVDRLIAALTKLRNKLDI